MDILEQVTLFLISTISLSTPMLLGALGQIVSQRSGVLNLGVEGIMLLGAIAGFTGASFTGNSWIGLLVAISSGVLSGLLLGFLVVTRRFNQSVAGIGFWFFGIGLSSYLFRAFFGTSPTPAAIEGFSRVGIPILGDVPILGAFFQQDILTYLTIFLGVPIVQFVLYKTTVGMKIRAVGENPRVADSLGINVFRLRYLCVIFSCIMASLGGAYLSMVYVKMFSDEMTSGLGWVSISLCFFSRWNAYLALFAAFLFGGAYAFAFRARVMNIPVPDRFLLAIPYILTIVSLCLLYRRASTPAALGKPYER